MTLEILVWGENTEVRLYDDLGLRKRFYMRSVRVESAGGVDAEIAYETLKELREPPAIYGKYAHLNPLVTGVDEYS